MAGVTGDPIEDAITSVQKLRRWERHGEAAPHKPLLLLLALKGVHDGAPSFVDFNTIERPLRDLLRQFGPGRVHLHPEYPFWRLQNDGLWVVLDAESFPARQSNTDPPISALRSHHAQGGFPPDLDGALRRDPDGLRRLVRVVATTFFAGSAREVLGAIGLEQFE
jgi:putative restriction endonuclease